MKTYDEDGNEIELPDFKFKLHGLHPVAGQDAQYIWDCLVSHNLIQGTIFGVYFSENKRKGSIEMKPFCISVSVEIDNLSREEMIGIISEVSMPVIKSEAKTKRATEIYVEMRAMALKAGEAA